MILRDSFAGDLVSLGVVLVGDGVVVVVGGHEVGGGDGAAVGVGVAGVEQGGEERVPRVLGHAFHETQIDDLQEKVKTSIEFKHF